MQPMVQTIHSDGEGDWKEKTLSSLLLTEMRSEKVFRADFTFHLFSFPSGWCWWWRWWFPSRILATLSGFLFVSDNPSKNKIRGDKSISCSTYPHSLIDSVDGDAAAAGGDHHMYSLSPSFSLSWIIPPGWYSSISSSRHKVSKKSLSSFRNIHLME